MTSWDERPSDAAWTSFLPRFMKPGTTEKKHAGKSWASVMPRFMESRVVEPTMDPSSSPYLHFMEKRGPMREA